MRRQFYIVFLLLFISILGFSQTKKEIEKRIENTKKEIELTSKLIKETELSKKQSYSKLELITRKIELRKEFINDIDKKLFNKLVIFDISGFGNINHYYGYQIGEKVLIFL